MRVALLRLGAFGDVVHAFPLACALHDGIPDVRLAWCISSKWSWLLERHEAVDEVMAVDGLLGAHRALRAWRPDVVVDPQGLIKTGLLAAASGARRRIGYGTRRTRGERAAAIFYTDRVAELSGASIVLSNLELARVLGVEVGEPRFGVPRFAEAGERVERFLRECGIGSPFLVFHPGTSWPTKRWPPERFAQLGLTLARRRPGLGFVVTCGPGEKGEAARACPPGGALFEPPGLPELAELLRRAALLVAPDTGVLHLAVAVGTQVLGLYGPTDPVRNGFWREGDRFLVTPCPQSPCWRRTCARACLAALPPETVADAVLPRIVT